MLDKRIIPCLDVRDGKVVKGINFVGIKEVGDPVQCAEEYNRQGADEIVFLDITATHEHRGTMADVVRKTAEKVFVPLTVGGGIRTIDDFQAMLRAGADKVSVNSAALRRPELIAEAADKFGSQCVVVAIDAKKMPDGHWHAYLAGGREDTGIDALEWARQGVERGAGELVVNSIDTDGVKEGFDLELLDAVAQVARVPIIASGGAGKPEDFARLFARPGMDAGLAASIFHTRTVEIGSLKEYLRGCGVEVRL